MAGGNKGNKKFVESMAKSTHFSEKASSAQFFEIQKSCLPSTLRILPSFSGDREVVGPAPQEGNPG